MKLKVSSNETKSFKRMKLLLELLLYFIVRLI